MRYVVTLYRAVRKEGVDEPIKDEKVADLSTHTSEVRADARTEALNIALGHKFVDGWFTPKNGDLFAMYE